MNISYSSFSALGYPALFVWIFLEQIGLPIPAMPFLFAVGLMIDSGTVAFVPSLLIALVACLIPDFIWYYLGKSKGGEVLNLICKVSWKPDTCITKTKTAFNQYGSKTLLFAKFIPGLNTLAPPLTGMAEVPVLAFLGYDAVGSLLWAAVPLLAGIYFKANVPTASALGHLVRTHLLEVMAVVVGAILLWRFYNRFFYRKQLDREREQGISPTQLKELIDQNRSPFLIDARDCEGVTAHPATLPGAQWIEYDDIEARLGEIPLDQPIITYCNCPRDEGSVAMAQLLRKLGAKSAHPLRGGIEAWEKLGYKTTKLHQSAPPAPAEMVV